MQCIKISLDSLFNEIILNTHETIVSTIRRYVLHHCSYKNSRAHAPGDGEK